MWQRLSLARRARSVPLTVAFGLAAVLVATSFTLPPPRRAARTT